MNDDELRETYETLSESEAFEAFEMDGVDPMRVIRVLGASVAGEYTSWIYFNCK